MKRRGNFSPRLRMADERSIIERIRRAVPSRESFRSGLRLGIGDDAAVLAGTRDSEWVVSADMFLENVHFLAAHPPDAVGYKALARATSDLTAMGAAPRYFLLSLALPARRAGKWLDRVLRGMSRAAKRFRLVLAGGDTAEHATVAMSITVFGEVAPGRAVKRSGARPGDLIFVSGRLGAAQLGLELVRRGLHRERRFRSLLRPHFYPELRLDLGQWLARPRVGVGKGLVSAMIDTSDGLSTDLANLCRASNVGAKLYAEKLPAVQIPEELARLRLDSANLALHGGEDYELLFCVPASLARRIPKAFGGVPLTLIGEITRAKSIRLVDAHTREIRLEAKGWEHFRGLR